MLALLTSLVICTAALAKPAVLFLNFGDESPLGKTMQDSADLARTTFSGSNFTFHLVSPQANYREAMAKAFAEISAQHPEQLLILTIGHGEIVNFQLPVESYPLLTNPSSIFHPGPLSFVFMNGRNDTNMTRGKEEEYGRFHLGVGDWQRLITEFQASNPQTPIKIVMAQCYGGHPSRVLNKIPGVKAYSGSSDSLKAKVYPSKFFQRKASFLDYFMEFHKRAQLSLEDDVFDHAFEQARQQWMQELVAQKTDKAEVPWSPTDAKIQNWCANENERPLLPLSKESSDLTLAYEKYSTEQFQRLSNCKDTKKLKFHQEGFQQATLLWSELSQEWASRMRKLELKEFQKRRKELNSPFYEEIVLKEKLESINDTRSWEDFREETAQAMLESERCLRETRSLHCVRKFSLSTFATLLNAQNWDSSKTNRYCSYETDENISPCLKATRSIAKSQLGMASENVIRILGRTYNFAVEACTPHRYRYYENCFRKFWSQPN